MPIYDGEVDALVVIIADTENEENQAFLDRFKTLFDASNYVIYSNLNISGDELFRDLWNKIRSRRINMPLSQRMIFCTLLDLADVTEDWRQGYQNLIRFMHDNVVPQTAEQHYYITGLKYHSVESLASRRDSIVHELTELNNPDNFVQFHTEFLLYATGFNTLNSQLAGMANIIYRIAGRGWTTDNFYLAANLQDGVYQFAYDNYYERKAQLIKQRLDEVELWLTDRKLNDGSMFLDRTLTDISESIVNNYEEKMKFYNSSTGLYPISVQEFERYGFFHTKYRRKASSNRQLDELKDDYIRNFFANLNLDKEIQKFNRSMDSQATYSDIKELSKDLEDGLLQNKAKSIADNIRIQDNDIDKEKLQNILYSILKDYIEKKSKNLKDEYERKLCQLRNLKAEGLIAGKYRDLQDCVDHIRDQTDYMKPVAIEIGTCMQMLIISGDVYNNIHLSDSKRVWQGKKMDEIEVEYMKFASLIQFNNKFEDVQSTFKRIITH